MNTNRPQSIPKLSMYDPTISGGPWEIFVASFVTRRGGKWKSFLADRLKIKVQLKFPRMTSFVSSELPSLCLRILGAGGCGCGGVATRGMKAIIIPFNIFSFIGDSAIIFHGTRDFIKVPKCTEPKSFIPFIVIVNFRSCGVFFSPFFLVRMFFPSQLRLLLSCQKDDHNHFWGGEENCWGLAFRAVTRLSQQPSLAFHKNLGKNVVELKFMLATVK